MMRRNEQAAAIWPHLAGDRPAPRETSRQTSQLAASMYPKLAPPKPQPRNYYRESLLKNLRELNARHRQG
jgi:hypothetical protein